MRNVKIKKSELLERVKANRTKHHAAVVEAQGGYRAAVIKELDHMLHDAKEGKRISTTVDLIMPVDHTKDYDLVIDMLTMSTDDIVELDANNFKAYVRDEWQWDAQFASANRMYANTTATLAYIDGKSREEE